MRCEDSELRPPAALFLGMSSPLNSFQLTPRLFLSCLGLVLAICSPTGGQGGGAELSVNFSEYGLPGEAHTISHLILSMGGHVGSISQMIKPKRVSKGPSLNTGLLSQNSTFG